METNSSCSKSNLSYRTNRPGRLGKSYTLKSIVWVPRTAPPTGTKCSTTWAHGKYVSFKGQNILIFAGPSNSIEENSFLQRFNIPSFQVLSAGILHQRQMTEPTMVGTGLSFVHSPLSLAGLFVKLRTPGTGLQNSVSREESNWVMKN